MKNDNILLGQIKDRYYRSLRQNRVCSTDFLDINQRSEAQMFLQSERIKGYFYGGYDGAERTKLYFLPEYMQLNYEEFLNYIVAEKDISGMNILRVISKKGSKALSHRDYLGSLMSLGIKREKLGDIIVYENGADIIVASEMAEYLSCDYVGAGRVKLIREILPICDIKVVQSNIKEVNASVASLRVDAVLSQAYGIARSGTAELIKSGLVYINDVQVYKSNLILKEGDKIVVRGKGKVMLKEIGNMTRKGRISLLLEKYI